MVPNSCMWRRAAIVYFAISACPNGVSNCTGPRPPNERFEPRRRALRSARVVEPYTSTTTSTWPAMIAAVACSTMNSQVEPPTPVPSTQVGRRPRYSPISIGESRPVPLDAEAVDVVLGEAGVGDRTRRGLVVELVRGVRVDPADVGQCRADERDPLRSLHALTAASIRRACRRRTAAGPRRSSPGSCPSRRTRTRGARPRVAASRASTTAHGRFLRSPASVATR